jgi:hypothetical protein
MAPECIRVRNKESSDVSDGEPDLMDNTKDSTSCPPERALDGI